MIESSNDDNNNKGVNFLQWALPKMGYRWDGFSNPREQVLKRIRERMAELELSGGYAEYKSYLEEHPKEWERLDKLCDVTISKFFRDRKLWDFLREKILTELVCYPSEEFKQNSEKVHIWSAGCCNGEEPYSVAMIYEQLKKSKLSEHSTYRRILILATDRNDEVLKRAQIGRYPPGSLKELDADEIETFFEKSEYDHQERNDDEPFKIKSRLKEYIEFEKRDIRESLPEKTFDIIFCRNLVFTYFTEERQKQFLKRLKPHLKVGGYLVLGSNEEIPEAAWLEPVSDTHPVLVKVK